MAKEVLTIAWCDVCLDDDNKVDDGVRTHKITIDGRSAELDLCPQHQRIYLGDLQALIRSRTTGPQTGRGGDARVRCGDCRTELRSSARAQHVERAHWHKNPWDITWAWIPADTPRLTCPDC
ncbi:MAG: hypothetical protein L0Y54_20300, partial [Sporichthyaceae bacterium]|nr:hypothetical protein [Sporichthyaceae bacterium]